MENLNMDSNQIPAQQVYIIQLDQSVQYGSQAIPLQILENDLNGDFILPLMQQKQDQPLQLLVEPLSELNDVVIKKHQVEVPNEIASTIQKISNIPTSTMLTEEKPCPIKTQFLPISVKKKPGHEINAQNSFNEAEIRTYPKQKIKNYVHMSDTKAPPRAVAVLPAALHFRRKLILPRRTLSSHIRFGPVQGIRKIITKMEAAKLLSNSKLPVFLLNQDKEHVIHIDVTDKDKSNWLGLLSLAEVATPMNLTNANVWLYEENNELYALTVQPIPARTPLKLGYSKKYCEDHNICDWPSLDLETVNSVQWWCNECNRALPSATLLQRHTDVYHKITVKSSWLSYRCEHCRRPFGRLFTLKRHLRFHCTKKPKKPTTTENSQEPAENNQINPEPDISSALEDNRIPSDESFQNFTNSLDFSTNLFDTDRIAGLDISGHSRADSELNPYSISFRDDNGLSNDLGFTKLTNGVEGLQSIETSEENNMPILDTCSYCNQVVAKQSKSKHLRQCPSRLICECGRVFRHKRSLVLHIHKAHPREYAKQTDKFKAEDDEEMAYKCQECPLGFKRRGMLVNHLWRIHKMISTTPVEKKVKRYPCVVCPRIYCSASKRDIHVRIHHPGSEKLRAQSIEGGVKSCQAASCTECPRQYATRAKLLQHIRAQHPHLANSIYKQETEQKAKRKLKRNNKKRETTNNYIATGNQPRFGF